MLKLAIVFGCAIAGAGALIQRDSDLNCNFDEACLWRNGTNGVEDDFDWPVASSVVLDSWHSIPRSRSGRSDDYFAYTRGTHSLGFDDSAALLSDTIPCQLGPGKLSFWYWKTALVASFKICTRTPPGPNGVYNCFENVRGLHRQEWIQKEVEIPPESTPFEIEFKAAFQRHYDIIGIDDIVYEATLCEPGFSAAPVGVGSNGYADGQPSVIPQPSSISYARPAVQQGQGYGAYPAAPQYPTQAPAIGAVTLYPPTASPSAYRRVEQPAQIPAVTPALYGEKAREGETPAARNYATPPSTLRTTTSLRLNVEQQTQTIPIALPPVFLPESTMASTLAAPTTPTTPRTTTTTSSAATTTATTVIATTTTFNIPTFQTPASSTVNPAVGSCAAIDCSFDDIGMCRYYPGTTAGGTKQWERSQTQVGNSLTGIFQDISGTGAYVYAGAKPDVSKGDTFVLESPSFSTIRDTTMSFNYYLAGVEGRLRVCIDSLSNCPFTALGKDVKITSREWKINKVDVPAGQHKVIYVADQLQKNYVIGLDDVNLLTPGSAIATPATLAACTF